MNKPKIENLEKYLKSLEKVAIAYSGGIDSTFLLFVANKILLKENVVAVIANGSMVSRNDYKEAIDFLNENQFQYIEVPYNPLEIKQFEENHKDRCYYCKKNLMLKLKEVAEENGFCCILDGKNADDLKVYRPGNKATEEVGILSPLAEFEFTKKEIRNFSKEFGIKFWDKPSNSCLATRFPYNTNLTKSKLEMVEKAEEFLKDLGISKLRVRVHNDIARIEIDKKNFNIILNNKNIVNEIKNLGFKFVTLDLEGFKSGSFD